MVWVMGHLHQQDPHELLNLLKEETELRKDRAEISLEDAFCHLLLLDVFIQYIIMQFSYQIFIANISVYIITLTILPKVINSTKKIFSINPGQKCPYF